jgi:hypothetical protein
MDSTTPTADVTPVVSPVNGMPTTLVQFLDDEAHGFRSRGTAEADFVATQIERIAQLARWCGATDPATYNERMDIWDAEVRARHYDRGWSDGASAVRDELRAYLPD